MLKKMTEAHDSLATEAQHLRAQVSIESERVTVAEAQVSAAKADAQAEASKASSAVKEATEMDAAELAKLKETAKEAHKMQARLDSLSAMIKMHKKKAEKEEEQVEEMRKENARLRSEKALRGGTGSMERDLGAEVEGATPDKNRAAIDAAIQQATEAGAERDELARQVDALQMQLKLQSLASQAGGGSSTAASGRRHRRRRGPQLPPGDEGGEKGSACSGARDPIEWRVVTTYSALQARLATSRVRAPKHIFVEADGVSMDAAAQRLRIGRHLLEARGDHREHA